MITASRVAGFFAAHAIWSVSEGATLIPILAYTTEDGQKKMIRLVADDLGTSVELGKKQLESNEMNADDAVLLFDGRIPVGGEKLDAIIIELRAYFSPDSTAVVAIPYTPATPGPFRVHKPKVLEWENCDDFDMGAAFQEFFQGVSEHKEGSAIWDRCLDESK